MRVSSLEVGPAVIRTGDLLDRERTLYRYVTQAGMTTKEQK